MAAKIDFDGGCKPAKVITAFITDVRKFDITGRPMKGWILVEPDAIETDDQLRQWIEQSLDFVVMLPKK